MADTWLTCDFCGIENPHLEILNGGFRRCESIKACSARQREARANREPSQLEIESIRAENAALKAELRKIRGCNYDLAIAGRALGIETWAHLPQSIDDQINTLTAKLEAAKEAMQAEANRHAHNIEPEAGVRRRLLKALAAFDALKKGGE